MRSICIVLALAALCVPGPAQEIESGKILETALEDLVSLKVTSASLHDQSLSDAPASVSVITAEEIRKHGFHTMAEALAYVRGAYLTYDYTYWSFGLRGFGMPGDYDVLILIQINGHSILDNVDEMGAWYGQDLPLDLSLIQRIEVVRGSSSALYGSNGIFGTINIVTKAPESVRGQEVRVETGTLGGKKIQVTMAAPVGKGGRLLLSASVLHDGGVPTLYFPQYDAAATNWGRAVGMDGEKGYHAFADLTWGNWELLALVGDRVKTQPVSWGEAVFNDPGTRAEDSRNFVEVSYARTWRGDRMFRWRAAYDNYRYRGIYHYALPEAVVEDTREREYGDWLTTGATYRMPSPVAGAFTIGSELKFDLRTMMSVYDLQPQPAVFLNINKPDINAGFFAQQEWELGRRWQLDLGARYDWSHYRQSAISPRGALIFQPDSKTSLKFLVGRGFRNPSAYEMFFDDGGLSAKENPLLRPSTAMTYEVAVERRLATRIRASVSVYRYSLRDMISAAYTPDGLQQYQNFGGADAAGVEMEVTGKLPRGMEGQASFAIQRATLEDRSVLPNSPGQIGKLRFSIPLSRERAYLAAGLQYAGERRSLLGAVLPRTAIPEVALSVPKLLREFEASISVRNLFNQAHSDPIAMTPAVDTVPLPGRTVQATITWRSGRH